MEWFWDGLSGGAEHRLEVAGSAAKHSSFHRDKLQCQALELVEHVHYDTTSLFLSNLIILLHTAPTLPSPSPPSLLYPKKPPQKPPRIPAFHSSLQAKFPANEPRSVPQRRHEQKKAFYRFVPLRSSHLLINHPKKYTLPTFPLSKP